MSYELRMSYTIILPAQARTSYVNNFFVPNSTEYETSEHSHQMVAMSIFKWIELKPVAKQSDKTRESDIGNFKSTSIKIISSHLYEKIILFTVL